MSMDAHLIERFVNALPVNYVGHDKFRQFQQLIASGDFETAKALMAELYEQAIHGLVTECEKHKHEKHQIISRCYCPYSNQCEDDCYNCQKTISDLAVEGFYSGNLN